MAKFFGAPYPIAKTASGLLYTQTDVELIKSDLRQLLLTNPGERVMLPNFGTPLNTILFEPNDETVAELARQMIIDSIRAWEPRVIIQELEVTSAANANSNANGKLSPLDSRENDEMILLVNIKFSTFDDIQKLNALSLKIPLASN